MGSADFDELMASVDAPLIVVTTAADGVRAGCLVGFHSQSGMEPERYCVWLSKANHTYRVGLRATHFAVHFLTDADHDLAASFGTRTGEGHDGDGVDKFADHDVLTGPAGVPLLEACPHRMVLERIAILDDGADHVCVTARVVEARSSGTFVPLRVADVDDLEPGHGAEERAVDP